MSVDTVQPPLPARALRPSQDAHGNSGRDPRRDGKPAQSKKQPQGPRDVFLNDLGQLTGKTINIAA